MASAGRLWSVRRTPSQLSEVAMPARLLISSKIARGRLVVLLGDVVVAADSRRMDRIVLRRHQASMAKGTSWKC